MTNPPLPPFFLMLKKYSNKAKTSKKVWNIYTGAHWTPESKYKDPIDIWGLEMVLYEKYLFEVVFNSCAGPRERIKDEVKK